jgi:hypothetical protein
MKLSRFSCKMYIHFTKMLVVQCHACLLIMLVRTECSDKMFI